MLCSEAKVTEIYCLADGFCKEFAKYLENQMFSSSQKHSKINISNNVFYEDWLMKGENPGEDYLSFFF